MQENFNQVENCVYYKAGEKSNINRETINRRKPENHEKNFYKNYKKKFISFEVKI